MSGIFAFFIIAGIISYIGLLILEPEKHILGLVILAVLYAIFGAFFETTGAKADYNRKKRG